jgi:hypothetical protein
VEVDVEAEVGGRGGLRLRGGKRELVQTHGAREIEVVGSPGGGHRKGKRERDHQIPPYQEEVF